MSSIDEINMKNASYVLGVAIRQVPAVRSYSVEPHLNDAHSLAVWMSVDVAGVPELALRLAGEGANERERLRAENEDLKGRIDRQVKALRDLRKTNEALSSDLELAIVAKEVAMMRLRAVSQEVGMPSATASAPAIDNEPTVRCSGDWPEDHEGRW